MAASRKASSSGSSRLKEDMIVTAVRSENCESSMMASEGSTVLFIFLVMLSAFFFVDNLVNIDVHIGTISLPFFTRCVDYVPARRTPF